MFSLSDNGVDDNDDGLFVIHCRGRGWQAFAPPVRHEVTPCLVKSMMSLAARHTAGKSACKLLLKAATLAQSLPSALCECKQ